MKMNILKIAVALFLLVVLFQCIDARYLEELRREDSDNIEESTKKPGLLKNITTFVGNKIVGPLRDEIFDPVLKVRFLEILKKNTETEIYLFII